MSPSPKRIQLRRTQGWRKPEGAIVVARPSKWGNPHRIGPDVDRRTAVALFSRELRSCLDEPDGDHRDAIRAIAASLPELAGHDLACWCPLAEPCHADVLLELANPTGR
jgi:hypothetical protein